MPPKFKKLSNEAYELRYSYHEGGINRTSSGKWAWWVRSKPGRGAGESATLKSAQSSVLVRIYQLENGY